MPGYQSNVLPLGDSTDTDPTIVVGIDMGLTYTGAAFSTMNMHEPHVIPTWPGTNEVAYKVPTRVGYRGGQKGIKSWGFECRSPGNVAPGTRILDCFKLYLDQVFLQKTFEENPDLSVGEHEDVQMWFEHFLKEIYAFIARYICDALNLPDWNFEKVHYVFSVPTGWEGNTAVIETFKKVIRCAGFGKHGTDHVVEIDLTEAEAAAVYTARSSRHQQTVSESSEDGQIEPPIAGVATEGLSLEKGHILLVCDSGGGTTDISVLQVESIESIKTQDGGTSKVEDVAKLKRLDIVDGPRTFNRPIGSVQIDEAFKKEVERRLKLIPRVNGVPHIPDYAASEMSSETFRGIKEQFGTSKVMLLPEFRVPVPGLPSNFYNERARIENGRMLFTKDEVKRMFDVQIERIFEAINLNLKGVEDQIPPDQIMYFVLSGGLGSSRYVQDRIVQEYGPRGYGKKILISGDPQLAVCKGLVIDKVFRLKHAESVSLLNTRCSRASYGIVMHEPYDRQKHTTRGTQIRKNPIDDNRYAIGQIDWLIQQGQPVQRDVAVRQKFRRIVAINSIPAHKRGGSSPDAHTDTEMKWRDTIVMSTTPPSRLPSHTHEPDAHQVGHIVSALDARQASFANKSVLQRKSRRGRWLLNTVQYWMVELEVLVFIGLSELRFEIHFAGHRIGGSEQIHASFRAPDRVERSRRDDLMMDPSDDDDGGGNAHWPQGLIRMD